MKNLPKDKHAIKNWNYLRQTPAFGKVFQHKTRRVLLVVYQNSIRLFRDFPSLKDEKDTLYPCYAETQIHHPRT